MNHLKTSNERPSFFLTLLIAGLIVGLVTITGSRSSPAQGNSVGNRKDGKHLFERETFGGNGRTCLTCHSRTTGTVSPRDAEMRHAANPRDPLFVHDGSDDGLGHGVTRMRSDATILMEIPLPPNVSLADDPRARSVVLRRGIPTTLNTPALDPVLMYDGRERNLQTQALGAIRAHTQHTEEPSESDLRRIAQFQLTDAFFTSSELMRFARGGPAPGLPQGATDAERRGRLFFEDVGGSGSSKPGICATCHSGPMLNQTNQFFPLPLPPGSRFQDVLVSALNAAGKPGQEFSFQKPGRNHDGREKPRPRAGAHHRGFAYLPLR